MVLVVTGREDMTADWLALELNRRGAPFVRFNTDDYPARGAITWTLDGASLSVPDTGEILDLATVRSVWFRRPAPPKVHADDEALNAWAAREAREALLGVWRTMQAPLWVNHPDANYVAGCKPEQLHRAARLGFDVPSSIVTSDPGALRAFAATHGADLICKPLYNGWIPSAEGNRVFWTTKFEVTDSDPLDDLGPEPYLFQERIEKSYEVRVTVIGHEAYAVGIGSQTDHDSATDWRRGDVNNLAHWIEPLPAYLGAMCVQLVSEYGLAFGAIDLARTPDNRWVFFELNANGQWAWLEQRTAIPLSAALADLLLSPERHIR